MSTAKRSYLWGAKTRLIPCAWLVFDPRGDCICSAPACVEKAYREARPLAESIELLMEAA